MSATVSLFIVHVGQGERIIEDDRSKIIHPYVPPPDLNTAAGRAAAEKAATTAAMAAKVAETVAGEGDGTLLHGSEGILAFNIFCSVLVLRIDSFRMRLLTG